MHVPNHGHDHEDELPAPTAASGSQEQPSKIEVRTAARITKRSAEERFNDRYNETVSAESLRLRKVVRVVGPDDLPELAFRDSSSVYGMPISFLQFTLVYHAEGEQLFVFSVIVIILVLDLLKADFSFPLS